MSTRGPRSRSRAGPGRSAGAPIAIHLCRAAPARCAMRPPGAPPARGRLSGSSWLLIAPQSRVSAPARHCWVGGGDLGQGRSTARTGGGRFSSRLENLDGQVASASALRAANRSRRAGHYPCGWGRSWGIAWVRLRIGARGPRSRSSTGPTPGLRCPWCSVATSTWPGMSGMLPTRWPGKRPSLWRRTINS